MSGCQSVRVNRVCRRIMRAYIRFELSGDKVCGLTMPATKNVLKYLIGSALVRLGIMK